MIRSRVARKAALVGAGRFVRVSRLVLMRKKGAAYLVRCHIKVNLGRTRGARLVPAVFVNGLARKDKIRELLNARVEIFHRLALIQLLQTLSIGQASSGDMENHLACREATGLLRCLRFLLFLFEAFLELVNLLPVPFKQRVGVDDFLFLRIQLYLLDTLCKQQRARRFRNSTDVRIERADY